jgi:acid phosphatase
MFKALRSTTFTKSGLRILYPASSNAAINFQDYDKAFSQTDLAFLATQGILLTNYYALTHPSEPNYVSVVGGDYFGIGDDNLHAIPQQVASVVDVLEEAGISWAEYEEDMPYTGFQGFNYTNPATNYVDYVRKHNPLVHLPQF